MNWIAELPYYKVEREVNGIEQKTIIQDRLMQLYDDRLVTRHREFPIHEVHDISYRIMGGEHGFLYLHTLQGVYSYTVKCDPEAFIEAFRSLTQHQSGE
ncbi:hypothetical protein D3C71_1807760 [compost metagenome]